MSDLSNTDTPSPSSPAPSSPGSSPSSGAAASTWVTHLTGAAVSLYVAHGIVKALLAGTLDPKWALPALVLLGAPTHAGQILSLARRILGK
jgi:hypothetical protein